jgi:hypothetical protein
MEEKDKICGCLESCFETGSQWGHFEYIMCNHLNENKNGNFCNKDTKSVEVYMNETEYSKLKTR